MANIFTRKAVTTILSDEALTTEERTERLFSLYGQALDDGYVSKSAADAAKNAAVEQAKTEAAKNIKAPDPKESQEYKDLQAEYSGFKARQEARSAPEYAGIKPKFFDAVYDMIDRKEGAKDLKEQITSIRENYAEYFSEDQGDDAGKQATGGKPHFGAETKGSQPSGKTGPSFMDTWGFVPPKEK